MAMKLAVLAVVVMVAAMLTVKTEANSFGMCRMSRDELRTCKPAVSHPAKHPVPVCCNALRKSDLRCFCGYKDATWLRFYGVDNKLAASLPARCGISWIPC